MIKPHPSHRWADVMGETHCSRCMVGSDWPLAEARCGADSARACTKQRISKPRRAPNRSFALSDGGVEEMVRLYVSGVSVLAIARALNCDNRTIVRALRTKGVRMRTKLEQLAITNERRVNDEIT